MEARGRAEMPLMQERAIRAARGKAWKPLSRIFGLDAYGSSC
jgi:hypothetical protein